MQQHLAASGGDGTGSLRVSFLAVGGFIPSGRPLPIGLTAITSIHQRLAYTSQVASVSQQTTESGTGN